MKSPILYHRLNMGYSFRRWALRKAERWFGGTVFDPIAEAAAGSDKMEVSVDQCSLEWTVTFSGAGSDGKTRDAEYKIDWLFEVRNHSTFSEALRRACWEHCRVHGLYPHR